MLNIYYGGEQTDREKFIFEHMKGNTLLLVPDQFSLQAERDAFFYLKKNSLIDLRVIDFSTLGHKVIRQAGGKTPDLVDKYGRHMLLTKIVSKMEDRLNIYKGLNWKSSFIEMLNSAISEMKRYDVSEEDLERTLDLLDDNSYLKYKLRDILTIYRAYQQQIQGKYLDSEDYITFYGDKILEAPMVRESEVWIYGFDTFTPKNFLVIERLLRASRGVNVVMTYEKDNEIFYLTGYVMRQLSELAEKAGISSAIKSISGKPRETVWSHRGIPAPVTLVSASNMYTEADRAAAYILKLVREKGYKFGDIVVVCNDTDIRGGILRRTFMRWGIPVFMDKKRKVLHHQAVSFLLALMEVIAKGYRDDALMRLVKSGIMDFNDDEKELLENYVKQFRIRGFAWKKIFSKGTDTYSAEDLNKINDLRQYVVDMVEKARLCMGGRNTAGDKIRGLYDFLEKDFAMTERLEEIIRRQEDMGLAESAAETSQSWDVICNIFDQIVEIIGNEKSSNEELLSLMTSGFEDVEIGLVPVSPDCVLIGTLQRTRLSRLKALLVVGANEGVLPLNRNDEGLLSEHEKAILQSMDLEISKRDEIVKQEEQLSVLRTLYLPEEYLYVSCSGVDEKGEESRPSEVFTELKKYLQKMNGGESEESISVFGDLSDSDCFLDKITSKEGTLSYMADALREYHDGGQIDTGWLQVMNWYEDKEDADFKRVKKGMLFDNKMEMLGNDFADSLYRGERAMLEVSSSRLEQYSKCPFAHFIMYGLRAEQIRVYEMGAREIGDIYHRCLMKLSQNLTPDRKSGMSVNDEVSPWMTITQDECFDQIEEIIKNDLLSYREGILISGKEEEYRTERIAEICSRIAWSMIQQVRKGNIKAMRFEYPFGSGKDLPPVKVDIGEQQVFIQGKIDRLDIIEGETDAVRIIDYKTGDDSIDPEHFIKGYKLQLMVYLKAALESSYEAAQPAGIFYFKIKDIDMDADTTSIPQDSEDFERKIADAYKLEGILLDDESVINSMDTEINGASHVIPVKVSRKEGRYVSSSGGYLMSKDEFRNLYQQVDMQVKRICRELCEGKIDIKPKREGKRDMEGNFKTACKYCSYKSICMFDTSFDGCRYDPV